MVYKFYYKFYWEVIATKQCDGIKSKHLHFAKIEQKVYMQSIGPNPAAYLSSSSSESDDDVTGADEASSEQGDLNRPEENPAHAKSNVSEQLSQIQQSVKPLQLNCLKQYKWKIRLVSWTRKKKKVNLSIPWVQPNNYVPTAEEKKRRLCRM